jgi:DNA-binding transcriptional LysR family regulator
LARFGALHPEIELAFAEGEAARLEELLLGGDLDVAVAAGLGPTNRRLRHHRLYSESVVVIFPLGHRFGRQESVRLADLKHESLFLRPNCVKRALLLESCRTQGFEPRIVSCEREDSIQMIVAAGRGVTIMPENLHLGHGTSARQLIEPALNREVSLVTVAGRPLDLPVQHFIRAIRAHRWDDESSRASDGQYQCRLSSKVFSVGNAPSPRARAGERAANSRANPEVSRDRQIDDRAASSDTD